MKIREALLNLSWHGVEELFAKHYAWAKEAHRISGSPRLFGEPGTLNLFGIDCDTNGNPDDNEIEFNFGRYKDFLLIIFNNPDGSFDKVLIEVTLDPETDKYGRMNLMPGVYDAYKVGIHGVSSGLTSVFMPGIGNIPRWGIRQDRNAVFVARTDGKAKPIKFEWSMAYSNIHNPGKSAGCTVTKSNEEWYNKLLPYIYDVVNKKYVPVNHDNLTYSVMNHFQLENYLEQIVEREELADAENGIDVRKGEAKGATAE